MAALTLTPRTRLAVCLLLLLTEAFLVASSPAPPDQDSLQQDQDLLEVTTDNHGLFKETSEDKNTRADDSKADISEDISNGTSSEEDESNENNPNNFRQEFILLPRGQRSFYNSYEDYSDETYDSFDSFDYYRRFGRRFPLVLEVV
nr:uncharacterized protein LOC128702410 [Cherax quadricarinatus]